MHRMFGTKQDRGQNHTNRQHGERPVNVSDQQHLRAGRLRVAARQFAQIVLDGEVQVVIDDLNNSVR